MKTYEVLIDERRTLIYLVNAENEEEAREVGRSRYEDGDETDIDINSTLYGLEAVEEFFVLRVDERIVNENRHYVGRHHGWWDSRFDIAEIIVYDRRLSPAEEATVGGYLAWKYGISSAYPDYQRASPGIENDGITGLAAGEAGLNGTLHARQAVYDVWVYWATSNHGTDRTAWLADPSGGSQHMGSFTNVGPVPLLHTATGLAPAATYFYTYHGRNLSEEMWGDVLSFSSFGPPTVEKENSSTSSPRPAVPIVSSGLPSRVNSDVPRLIVSPLKFRVTVRSNPSPR